MIDPNGFGFVIFGLGTIFGIVLSYFVSDLVFAPSQEIEDENNS